jgi:hypothetical protein
MFEPKLAFVLAMNEMIQMFITKLAFILAMNELT